MALFGRKKKAEVEEVKEDVKTESKTKTTKAKTTKTKAAKATSEVVKKEETTNTPKVEASKYSYRITEKATRLSEKNVYVLNIPKDMNKTELKKELQKKYKVTVLGINIVNSPKKTKVYRGRLGQRGGGKKAYITLKAGESIIL